MELPSGTPVEMVESSEMASFGEAAIAIFAVNISKISKNPITIGFTFPNSPASTSDTLSGRSGAISISSQSRGSASFGDATSDAIAIAAAISSRSRESASFGEATSKRDSPSASPLRVFSSALNAR